MEELAARQYTIQPSGGVLFARNADGVNKSEARQKILDLFSLENWMRPLNMLTMPGLQWRFERKLLGAREAGWLKNTNPIRTHFTGVENDRAIYFAAVTQIPGVETPHRLIKPVRKERFPFAELAVKTRFASFFFANVDDFLSHDWTNRAQYRDIPPGWDAVWLDYTGPLSIARMDTISKFFHEFVREVLIVTSLKARWDRKTVAAISQAGGYSEWLRKHLPGRVLHDIEYLDTSPMSQFAVRHTEKPE